MLASYLINCFIKKSEPFDHSDIDIKPSTLILRLRVHSHLVFIWSELFRELYSQGIC